MRRDGACMRCDPTLRPLLPPMALKVERFCVQCGQPFEAYAGSVKSTCSPRCSSRRWRAYVKLLRSTPP